MFDPIPFLPSPHLIDVVQSLEFISAVEVCIGGADERADEFGNAARDDVTRQVRRPRPLSRF